MKISTRSRYGLRLMLDLALNAGKGPIYLKEISKRQEISEKYLSQIIMPLKARGMVQAFRGVHGGYVLARRAASISLREIVEALEGELSLVACVSDPSSCARSKLCSAQNIWSRVSRAIADTLGGISLGDLVRDQEGKQARAPQLQPKAGPPRRRKPDRKAAPRGRRGHGRSGVAQHESAR